MWFKMNVLQRGLCAQKHPAFKPELVTGTLHHPHCLDSDRSQDEQSLYLAQVIPGSGVGGAGVGLAQVFPVWSKGSHS